MRLKQIASALAILTISGCSLFPQEAREVEIITKPIKLDILQPTLPRSIELKEPRWYVVSDKKIAGEDRTYLDKFIEDIKKKHGGDVVFIAMSVADYELMAYNTQELKRYINQLGEVIVYYRNVTINDDPAGAIGVEVEE
jgi:hypothetical protein